MLETYFQDKSDLSSSSPGGSNVDERVQKVR